VFTQGHETTSLRGIQAALGEEAHLVGGCIFLANPPGLAVSPGGGGRDESATSGLVTLLCWPTATVASAFVSGAGDPPTEQGRPERPPATEGKITDLYTSERGSVVVKTIDGRPASEVWTSWLPANDKAHLRPWLDEIDGRDPLWRSTSAAVAAVCGQNAMGVRRAEGTVIVCVNDIRGGELEFLPGVEVFEGERLFPQFVDKARICERTHEAAKEVCAKQGINDIRGAFTFSCALNVMLGEADGMQDVSDKMACALGSAPLFGMIGGPELGHAYGDKASFACVMYSCLVFQ
jgi:hypothetical protein